MTPMTTEQADQIIVVLHRIENKLDTLLPWRKRFSRWFWKIIVPAYRRGSPRPRG